MTEILGNLYFLFSSFIVEYFVIIEHIFDVLHLIFVHLLVEHLVFLEDYH